MSILTAILIACAVLWLDDAIKQVSLQKISDERAKRNSLSREESYETWSDRYMTNVREERAQEHKEVMVRIGSE